jgi:hypothetical protein
MASRKSSPPSRNRRQDENEEREARIQEVMERTRRHRARAEHHIEQANRFTERSTALKARPPNRKRRFFFD